MPVLSKPLDQLCREGQLITSSQGREVYAVTCEGIRAPMVVKHLSVPATQNMVSGLIYSGAVADEQAALQYYSTEIDELKKELALLAPLHDHPHFLPYLDSYICQKTEGVGYDVYLLTLRAESVRTLMDQHAFTSRAALELGLSIAEVLCALREQKLLHRDIRPENLFRDPEGNYRLGDLGVLPLDDLQYATQPDRYISFCTPPELCGVLGSANETADTYGLCMVLWTIFNGYVPPFGGDEEQRRSAAALPAPEYASPALGKVLCRACASQPEARYDSPAELLDALRACLDETSDTLILPPPEPETKSEPPAVPAAPAEPEEEAPAAPQPESEAAAPAETPAGPAPVQAEAAADAPVAVTEPAPDSTQPAEPAGSPVSAEPDSQADAPQELTMVDGEPLPPQSGAMPEPSARFHSAFAAAYEDDGPQDDLTADPSRVRGPRRLWLKIAVPILSVAVVGAIAFGVVTYLRHRAYTVDQLTLAVEGADTLRVSITAPEKAQLSVSLTDASGRVLQSLPYQGQDLYFEDLDAGTEYGVTLQSEDEHKLDGIVSGQAVTPMPTELLTLDAKALSPTEIELEFTSTGYEPDHWTLTFSNAEGQSQTSSFTGHSLVVQGLNAGENYAFTITDAENQPVLGKSTVECETETVVNLTSFELDDSVYGELTVRWASSGNYAKAWRLTCSGTDGSYRAEDITEQSDSFSYTFKNLPAGISYDVALSCDGLTNEADATRSIALPLCTVTDFVAYAKSSSSIQLSWNFIDGEQPERWRLSCTNVFSGESQVISLAENSYEFTGLLPDVEYSFDLSADNGLLVGGCEPTSARTLAAEKFDDYQTSGVFLGFFALPTKANWGLSDLLTSTNIFSTSGGMAFAVEVSYQRTGADKSVDTLYIIRDKDNNVVAYSTGTLSWSGQSVKETHFGGFEQCPSTAGDYTLEIYFNGKLLTRKGFTVI